MNKRELLYGLNQVRDIYSNCGNFQSGARTGLATAITLVEQLDESEKVVIPKIVADWIEHCKGNDLDLYEAFGHSDMSVEASDLVGDMDADILARAWLDGYEVEKEKLYRVIIPTKDKLFKYYYLDGDGGINMVDKLESVESHTEEFIRSISDDLWQFAVEVSE